MTLNGTHKFYYGADGIRCQKDNIYYTRDGDRILSEHNDNTGKTITYLYGEKGIVGFHYNGADYYYRKNIHNDVLAIYNTDGEIVAEYEYDAWGKVLKPDNKTSEKIADINPIRYRSYYYDVETGFYYLNSRYYDPEIGRFLNADTPEHLGDGSELNNYNLFAYCENNPVMYIDPTGHAIETVFDVLSLGFSILEVAANPYDIKAWAGLVGDAIDLIPIITGFGESIRGLRFVDKAGNTFEIARAVDFTDDTTDAMRAIDRSGTFTKSTRKAGFDTHARFKSGTGFNSHFKEYRKIHGVRFDYLDLDNNIIHELKPFNPRSAKQGIRQLKKYQELLKLDPELGKRVFTMKLEFY